MPQLAHYDRPVQDGSGNAVVGASVQVYREGATVNGAHSAVSPITVTVRHRGRIAAGDTTFIGTASGTTYSVDSVTATTVVLSGFSGTLVLANGDRIVPSNSLPTLYSDDQGGATKANPLTSSATGRVDAFIESGVYEILTSGAGLTTTLYEAVSVMSEGPAVVYSSETDSATAVAHIEDTRVDLTTTGAKLKSWRKAGTEKAYLDKDGSLSIAGNFLIGSLTALATSALGNVRWAHVYDSATSETDGIQEAIDSITDASATNPYTVMLRPGTYNVDRSIECGTQTGTADFTAAGTTVTGVGTKFKSTQALTGTATFTYLGNTVTGVGTLFTTELQVGDHIQRTTDTDDGSGTDHSGTFGRVLSIQSATSLTLESDGPYGGFQGWEGTSGSGNIRFREFRVGDHIYGGVDGATAASRISSIASDTSLTLSEGTRTVYAGTTQTGVAVKKQTNYRTGINFIGTGTSAKDWIGLVGMSRRECIVTRNRAAGSLTGALQCCPNQRLQNFTILPPLARIHWDTGNDDKSLMVDSCDLVGLSTGIGVGPTSTADAVMVLSNNYVKGGSFPIHDGALVSASYEVRIYIVGNAFTEEGTVIGLSFPGNGGQRYRVHLAGNTQPTNNVDMSSGGVFLTPPTTVANQVYVSIHTDGSLRINGNGVSDQPGNDVADYTWNSIIYPMERVGYQCVNGVQSGDVVIFTPSTAKTGTTTTANAQWPIVVCNQKDNTATANWWPRICTGPYGACWVESAQVVSPGDTLVTSVTAKDAFVNNAQTDLTRIIGWAFSGKTAGARRLVAFRRNMTLQW